MLNYQAALRNSIKSNRTALWIVSAIAVPFLIFIFLWFFEKEIAALLVFLFPPTVVHGFAFYVDAVFLARTEILWIGLFLLLTLILAVYPSRQRLANVFEIKSASKGIYYMMLITCFFCMTSIFIADAVLEAFPNSSDEYAYLVQAKMLSEGKLWTRAHDLPDFFYVNNIAQHEGILVSRFPPGWPLLLSVGFRVGLTPSLVNPLLGVLALTAFYFFVKRYYNLQVAVWSLFTVALTGFYLFNAASFFSHVSCLLATLLFVFAVHGYRERNSIAYALLAGLFIGFVVLVRYYTAVLIFIPFMVYLIAELRWKAVRLFFWMAVGGLPSLAYLLWYNYSITGNALMPVTMWAYPAEQLGFVKGHTFLKGVEHIVRQVLMFIYWTSPGLFILYAVFLWRKIGDREERRVRPQDYTFVLLALGYFFYYQIGGNQYGPRFYFEAFPFLAVFVVSNVLNRKEKWAMAIFAVSILYPVIRLPFIANREAAIVDQRQDVYDLVKEQNVQNAVVILASPTSPVRPMPADDLTRNDPMFTNDVLYVLEIPRINSLLLDYYADRSIYRYVRDLNDPKGELIKVR